MEYQGKRLLILAGQGVHSKVVEAAKEMGVYTIVTDYLPICDSPAKRLADEAWMLNIFDVDGIVEKCIEEKVDGVLNFCCDPAQKPYSEICSQLKLPCYGNANQFYALTNKKKFKQLCIENNLDVIETFSEVEILNGGGQYPIIVKPVDSRGSRGISLCGSKNEFVKAVDSAKKESSNGEVAIERYMNGKQDFTMTYLVKDGEPYLVRTGDRYLGNEEDNLEKQCVLCISPSRYTNMYMQNIDLKFKNLIKSLRIMNGPVFAQGFIDDETIKFYDPGFRFPGGEYERVLKKACGVDVIKKMIAFALDGKICDNYGNLKDSYKLCNKCSVQILVALKPGKIAKIEGLDEVRILPEVVYIAQKANVGSVIPSSGDVKQRIFEIILMTENDKEKICEAVRKVRECLYVEDDNGDDMIVSYFNPSIL